MAARPPPAAGSDLAARYDRDGYVVLADALLAGEAQALREEAVRICRGELGVVEGVQPPAADEPDELVVRRYLCIHFPHKLSGLLRATLAHPVLVDALTQLIGPDVKAMQSMLFIKSEGSSAACGWLVAACSSRWSRARSPASSARAWA